MEYNKIKRYILPAAISLCVILIFVLLSLSGYRAVSKEDKLEQLTFRGEYSTNGLDFIKLEDQLPDNEKLVILRGWFNRDILENEKIWLRIENIGVKIFVGGQEVFSLFQDGEFPKMFHSPGYAWESFASPKIELGNKVEIQIKSYYGNSARAAEAFLSSIYSGDGSGFNSKILKQFGFTGLVLLFALLSGVIYVFEGTLALTQGVSDGKRIVLFGFYCIAGGLWALPDAIYPYLSFIFSPAWLAGALDVIGMLLLPIALTLLIRFFMRGEKTKMIMTGAVWYNVIQAITLLILQLTGLCDLYQTQFAIAIIAAVQLICGIACITKEMFSYKDVNLFLLLLALLPVFLFIAIDGINFVFAFLPRRTTLKYALAVSFLILLYQFVSYAKNEKTKADKLLFVEKELNDSRIAVMLGQIQPHFLYNALGTIRALCAIDAGKAQMAIDKFSRYLRGNMDSLSQINPISFENELEHLKNYLYIEKLRFGDKLNICYDIKTTDFFCPPLTIQPLVENAIKHGVMQKESGGTVTISTCETESDYVIKIADDGVGFRDYGNTEKSHIGLSNTRYRLNAICRGVLIINNKMGITEIVIKIPKDIQKKVQ